MDIDNMFQQMVAKQASDLFVTEGLPISIKLHGELTAIGEQTLTAEQAKELVFACMNDKQQQEFEQTRECNFAIVNDAGRFRISAFWQRDKVGMVARRIVTDIPKSQDLGLPDSLQDVIMSKRGLVLFVGGTGTGKSTSLAALMGHRNAHSKGHILTIEDPIEFVHQHQNCIITQREVGIDTPSFESALKSSLRQAPDVILIGEIRSREVMEYALAFAETGHLCVATLHANNANQAIDRIMHLVPKDLHDKLKFDLALNLKAIVAQQLVPTLDETGRTAAVEILLNSPMVSELIKQGQISGIKEVMEKSQQLGMQTFDQALFGLYQNGRISYDNALHHADSPNDLRLKIKLAEKQAGSAGALASATIDGL